MLRAYSVIDGKNEKLPEAAGTDDLGTAVWIDLFGPTPHEVVRVQQALGVTLPTPEQMREIETSSRVFREGDGLFLTATVLCRADAPSPELMDLAFVVVGETLVTVRYDDPKPFYGFHHQVHRQAIHLANGIGTMVQLFEAILDRVADVLETTGHDLNHIARELLPSGDTDRGIGSDRQRQLLKRIARAHDVTAKARESLVTLDRIFTFVAGDRVLGADRGFRSRLKTLQQDAQSLADYTVFLSGNISFQLDALLGLVGIEQNNIVKIFSVASVAFLPPTLVASMYGMNFKHMPELHWKLGYPLALILMILSAVVPFLWFRKRGWL